MSKSLCKYSFITVFFLLLGSGVFAQQNKAELQKKREKIEHEIAYTNNLLKETTKNKQNTLSELSLINNKVNNRNELIATLKKESYLLDNEISTTENSIKNLNNDLNLLKKEYTKVVYFAYKYKTSYNKLIYLFSSKDLNQAFQRMRYLDQISEFIRKEAITIREKEEEKQKQLTLLNEQREEKEIILDKENVQLYKLESEKAEKTLIKNQMQAQEKNLRAKLKKRKRDSKKLEKQIETIIAKAIKSKTSTKKTSYSVTPEEKQLSKSFVGNKGKLPWPTDRGIISESFGVHNHPVLRGVKTKNNGVNIATSKGSDARSIFEGTVVSITTITNKNKAVIIRHGSYFTVYSNLESIYVKTGDKVKIKGSLGRIHTTNEGETELHFEVWNGRSKQNPAYWLKR